jgi:hypothetical protein
MRDPLAATLLAFALIASAPMASAAQPAASPASADGGSDADDQPQGKPAASPAPGSPDPAAGSPSDSICLMIESAAEANGLPVDFFARVIWRESRFQADAVGPVTRSGAQAQGIAQFMPQTAAERRLLDPFDPVQALPKSAEFLRQLADDFGNLGLAAAAYNAGPGRVRDWLDGRGALPGQTRAYVLAVTGRPAEEWISARMTGPEGAARESGADPSRRKATTCRELVALLKEAPNPFVAALDRRVQEGAASAWGVELAAGFSRDRVLRAYATIEQKFGAALAGHDPVIFGTRFRSRGNSPFFQIRVGASTRAEAEKVCASLRKAGAACLVLRNSVPGARKALAR